MNRPTVLHPFSDTACGGLAPRKPAASGVAKRVFIYST